MTRTTAGQARVTTATVTVTRNSLTTRISTLLVVHLESRRTPITSLSPPGRPPAGAPNFFFILCHGAACHRPVTSHMIRTVAPGRAFFMSTEVATVTGISSSSCHILVIIVSGTLSRVRGHNSSWRQAKLEKDHDIPDTMKYWYQSVQESEPRLKKIAKRPKPQKVLLNYSDRRRRVSFLVTSQNF